MLRSCISIFNSSKFSLFSLPKFLVGLYKKRDLGLGSISITCIPRSYAHVRSASKRIHVNKIDNFFSHVVKMSKTRYTTHVLKFIEVMQVWQPLISMSKQALYARHRLTIRTYTAVLLNQNVLLIMLQ